MPLYEYECTECKRHTEKIQKFSDAEITQCPHCGGLLERVVSAPAISFKGGGWYADGYGNAKPAAKSEGTSKSDSSGASGGSTDAGSSSSKEVPAVAASTPASAPAPAAVAPAASASDKK